MIQAIDFRIGNLVDWDMYKNLVVEGIIAYQNIKDTLHLKGYHDGRQFIVNASIGSIVPIELTDEVLLKCERVGKCTTNGWLSLNICNDWTFIYFK